MRVFAYSLIAVLAVALSSSAQQPAQENLDTVLAGWEKSMTDLRSFVAEAERTTLDKALGAKDHYKGYAMFVKGVNNEGSRARLELGKVSDPKVFEKFICTGPFLYEYAPANNIVRRHEMPKNGKDGMNKDSFLSFLFGMGAVQAKARYEMVHVVPNPPDKFYHYILIRPRTAQDKSDFVEARLSLFRSNNLPAQIWYLQPNKNEITWNFKNLQIDRQIPANYFEPDQPKGWRVENVQPKTPVLAPPAGK